MKFTVEYKYYPLFGQRLETSIIEEVLNYDLYQELLKAMINKDFEALSSCLANPVSPLISSYMRTSL